MGIPGVGNSLNIPIVVSGDKQADAAFKRLETSGTVSAQRISTGFTNAGRALTLGLTVPLIAAGGAVISIGVNAIETRNLIATTFGEMTDEIQAWSNTTTAAINQTQLASQEQAATFFNILNAMKLSRQESFELAKGFTELAADLGSFFNLNPEDAFLKLSAAITGEFEPLKRLGVILKENIIKQQAFNDGITDTIRDLTAAEKVQATFNAITAQASTALGDVARTSEDAASQLRQLQARTKEAAEEIGVNLVPVLNKLLTDVAIPLTDKLAELATAFGELDEEGQRTALTIAGIAVVAGPGLIFIGAMITAVNTLIISLATAAGLATALGAGLVFGVGAAAFGLTRGARQAEIEAGLATGRISVRRTDLDLTPEQELEIGAGILTGIGFPSVSPGAIDVSGFRDVDALNDFLAAQAAGTIPADAPPPGGGGGGGGAGGRAAPTISGAQRRATALADFERQQLQQRAIQDILFRRGSRFPGQDREAFDFPEVGIDFGFRDEQIPFELQLRQRVRPLLGADPFDFSLTGRFATARRATRARGIAEQFEATRAFLGLDPIETGLPTLGPGDRLLGGIRARAFPSEAPTGRPGLGDAEAAAIAAIAAGGAVGGREGVFQAVGGIAGGAIAAGSTAGALAPLLGPLAAIAIPLILGGLFGGRNRPEPVIEPIPVKVINFSDFAQELLNVTKGQLVQQAGVGISGLSNELSTKNAQLATDAF